MVPPKLPSPSVGLRFAQPMSPRPVLRVAMACIVPALTGGVVLAAQEASPYVPLQHWAMPYVEHLIAAGVIADPTPLTRPFRRGDLARALWAADTAQVNEIGRASCRGRG